MEAWKEKFVSWFATSGRMNRAAFVKRFFGVNLVCMAAVLVIGSRVIEETGSVFASNLVSGVLAALAAVFLYSPMVRRLHDMPLRVRGGARGCHAALHRAGIPCGRAATERLRRSTGTGGGTAADGTEKGTPPEKGGNGVRKSPFKMVRLLMV